MEVIATLITREQITEYWRGCYKSEKYVRIIWI